MRKPLNEVIEHHIYMAGYNRKMAHAYLYLRRLSGEPPTQFHWHMREAVRWIRVARHVRDEYIRNWGEENGKTA